MIPPVIDFRLENHTYEIIASVNPFEITCHVVNLLGALIVFCTLSLLFFTDIGLAKSFRMIVNARASFKSKPIKALRNTRSIVYQNLLMVILTNLLVKEMLGYILAIEADRNHDLSLDPYVPTEVRGS